MPSKKKSRPSSASSLDPAALVARQRERQLAAWKRQFTAGKTENIPKKVLASLQSTSSGADSSSSSVVKLTRSQAKNREKRARKARPCHRCGQPGHKKSECQSSRPASDDAQDLICFGCRGFGHLLRDCPNVQVPKERVCYKCGAEDHAARDCKGKGNNRTDDGDDAGDQSDSGSESSHSHSHSSSAFPLAVCFLCKGRGHLSRECPQSDHGIFPKGGQCKRCGSNGHKVKHCPEPETEEEKQKRRAEREEKRKRKREERGDKTDENGATVEDVDGNVAFDDEDASGNQPKKAKKQKKTKQENESERERETEDNATTKEKEKKKEKKTAKIVAF